MSALHLVGENHVSLKENCAAVRQRVSVMTMVTSVPEEARGSTLPLELVFKGKSKRILKDLRTIPGMKVTCQYAVKGSYRLEHVLRYLRRHLPLWTEEREAAGDYRLLFLDAYAAHLDVKVIKLAWSRGFLCVYHGGGTTGVAQVNDTHLHGPFERLF